jgi:hypothetical protein
MKTENEIINEHLTLAARVSAENVSAVVRVRTLYEFVTRKPHEDVKNDIKSGFHKNAVNFDIQYDFYSHEYKIVTSYF